MAMVLDFAASLRVLEIVAVVNMDLVLLPLRNRIFLPLTRMTPKEYKYEADTSAEGLTFNDQRYEHIADEIDKCSKP